MIAHFTSVHVPTDTRIFHRQLRSLCQAYPSVYYFCKEEPNSDHLPELKVHILNLPKNKYARLFFSWIVCTIQLARYRKKITVVQFHDPELLFFGIMAKIMGKKVIYDKHEDVANQIHNKAWLHPLVKRVFSNLYSFLERFSAYFFDVIITVTPTIVEQLSFHKDVQLIRNFPIKNELRISNPRPYADRDNVVFYVGEASVERGLDKIIKGYLESKKAEELIIIGRIVPEDHLKIYQDHPKFDSIKALGQQERPVVRELINKAKIGIIMLPDRPSFRIGYPNKIFEYMSVELPIVASNLPNLKAFIQDQGCGLCVPPNNHKEIGTKLDYLLDNTDIALDMGQTGRRLVEEKYSWDNDRKKFLTIYNSLLDRA